MAARAVGRRATVALCIALALAGCKTKEEKAQGYYDSALKLLDTGDVARAMVELRNVFKYDGAHKAARLKYADLLLQQGRVQEAASQYVRLTEQYPDLVDPHRHLAELALRSGNFDEARDQMDKVLALLPDDPEAHAIGLALRLDHALGQEDKPALTKIAAEAQALTQSNPDVLTGWQVLFDARNGLGDQTGALAALDKALAQAPKQYRLQVARLDLLTKLGRTDALGPQLETMQKLFPDDARTRSALIAWFVMRDDPNGALAFLRRIGDGPADGAQGYVELVNFLAQSRGNAAAATELDRLIAEAKGTPNARLFAAMRADLDFSAGHQDAALARMKALLADAPSGEQTDRLRVSYAQMLDRAGQRDAAVAQIDLALKDNPDLVAALRQRAVWLIDGDRPEDALVVLRRALQQAPQDPGTLGLMAQADLRDGAPDLAGARFAQAYEASNHGAPEARRYADFLLSQSRENAAAALLAEARQRNPDDTGILHRLADLSLRQSDWAQAQQIANHLESLGKPETMALSQSIRAAILLGRGQSDAAIDTLKSLASGNDDDNAIAAVIQAHLVTGRAEAARSFLEDALKRRPTDRGLRLLSANLDALTGKMDSAAKMLRSLQAEDPADSRPARQLYRLLAAQGDEAAAAAALRPTLAAQGAQTDPLLLAYRARSEQKAGDFDAAIATYETLYARNSDNQVLANNLASLLTEHRDDTDSLERAARIARRFRESPDPAFKDTYGWAEFKLGRIDDALPLLAAAAAGLPDNPVAQYHYAMALKASGKPGEAAQQLRQALSLAGSAPPPAMADAQAILSSLEAAPDN